VRSDRGQASVECVGLVLLVGVALGALGAASPAIDGRVVGGFLAHHLVCAVSGRCHDDERRLADAYGAGDAATVRALAPNLVYERGEPVLPVDWRRCRRPVCAAAPDDPGLDAHLTDAGERATAFTRVIRRGGRLYVQYWLYYPDSLTLTGPADRVWERSWLLPRIRELIDGSRDYPGYHRDDWESVQFRLDPDGSAWVRASSHGRYEGCRSRPGCRGSWGRPTGWVRVSRGSHAGHVPYRTEVGSHDGRPLTPHQVLARGLAPRVRRIPLIPGRNVYERSTTGEGLRLIPLETHDRRRYRRLDPEVSPPWRKEAYRVPEADDS
jgi:hypothetical protein